MSETVLGVLWVAFLVGGVAYAAYRFWRWDRAFKRRYDAQQQALREGKVSLPGPAFAADGLAGLASVLMGLMGVLIPIALILGILFALVRFIKWAWNF